MITIGEVDVAGIEGRELEEKVVSFSMIGDDMGGGASFCGECNYNVTGHVNGEERAYVERLKLADRLGRSRKDVRGPEYRCPDCHTKMRPGNIEPYGFGGSDFE